MCHNSPITSTLKVRRSSLSESLSLWIWIWLVGELCLPWLRRCTESWRTSAPRGSWWWLVPPWSGSSWSPPPSSCPSCRSGSWRGVETPSDPLHGINWTVLLPVLFSDLEEKLCQFRRTVLCIRETDNDWHWFGIAEFAASLAGVTESHVTSRDT